MRAPNPAEQEAIARIAARPEGQAVLEYLKACMADTEARLIREEIPHNLRAWQGEARVLVALIQAWKP